MIDLRTVFLGAFVILTVATVQSLSGATYYTAVNGNDSNPGTTESPWKTIQHAADSVTPGDTVIVREGSYDERIFTAVDGEEGTGRITFRAEGRVVVRGWYFDNPYTTIDGFEITGHSSSNRNSSHIRFSGDGDFTEVRNTTVRDGIQIILADGVFSSADNTISSVKGGFLAAGFAPEQSVYVGSAAGGVSVSNRGLYTVTNVTDTTITVAESLSNESPEATYLSSSYVFGLSFNSGAEGCIVRDSLFSNLGYDTWFIQGTGHLFENNVIQQVNGWDAMHFGGSDHVFHRNLFHNSPLAIYQVSPDAWENYTPSPYARVRFTENFVIGFAGVLASQKGQNTSTDLIIRNNVFVDVGKFNLTHPYTTIENNTFLRVARNSLPVVSRSSHPISIHSDIGATGVVVRNNVFVDCGQPVSQDDFDLVGWYEIQGPDETILALNNFVSGPQSEFLPRSGFGEGEARLNGGDPGFVNIDDPLGPDGVPFSDDDGLRLRVESKLRNAGVGNLDLGAYGEFIDTDSDGLLDTWESIYFGDLSPNSSDDPDLDGLSNQTEHNLGTDPTKSDTDGDGIPDAEETKSNPLKADSDDDGLNDPDEIALGTDPLNPDTDGDGIKDPDETKSDPLKADSDDDGLLDPDELNIGTDPLDPDSDDDGLLDGEETSSDPLKADSDDDGLSDFDEILIGSNPLIQDTDGDGLKDGVDEFPLIPLVRQFYRVRSGSDVQITGFERNGTITIEGTEGPGLYYLEKSHDFAPHGWELLRCDTLTSSPLVLNVFEFDSSQDMQLLDGGEFVMGDSFDESSGINKPAHAVQIDPFYIAHREVTNREIQDVFQWALDHGLIEVIGSEILNLDGVVIMSLNEFGSEIEHDSGTLNIVTGRSDYPCVFVSWYGAVSYCNFRSLMEGKEPCYDLAEWTCDFSKPGYRLPTEAEWEFAARGGLEGKRFPWGDLITHDEANYKSSTDYDYDVSPTRDYHPDYADARPRSSPIGSFAPNLFGLYDMCGNVLEWNWDWYARYPSDGVLLTNPLGPDSGTSKLIRGGSWFTTAERATCYVRFSFINPDRTITDVGFRVAMSAPSASTPSQQE